MNATILMMASDLERLPEYSHSIPTGTTVGKQWRCGHYPPGSREATRWVVCEYVQDPEGDPAFVGITYRPVKVVPDDVIRGRLLEIAEHEWWKSRGLERRYMELCITEAMEMMLVEVFT